MKRITVIIMFLMIYALPAYAWQVRTIKVDRCEMNVIVAQTAEEHAQGMLGQTDKSFTYDGMLFIMNNPRPKDFHTVGMHMNIRITGVDKKDSYTYTTTGQAISSPPGIPTITINGTDVLEIPENKYQLMFKNCLNINK